MIDLKNMPLNRNFSSLRKSFSLVSIRTSSFSLYPYKYILLLCVSMSIARRSFIGRESLGSGPKVPISTFSFPLCRICLLPRSLQPFISIDSIFYSKRRIVLGEMCKRLFLVLFPTLSPASPVLL